MRQRIIILIFLIVGQLMAQPLTVTTSVNKTNLAVDEQLVLTITLSGSAAEKVGAPQPPSIDDYFSYLGSRGTSKNIQFVNGKMTVENSTNLLYLATKAGTAIIPPVKVKYENKEYSSQPITVTISKSAIKKQSTPQQTQTLDLKDQLFLRAIVNKTKVYQNEPVIVTFRIYTKVSITNYAVTKNPETSGFWAEDFDLGRTSAPARKEVYKGIEYTVADLRKVALFPTSAGNKTIGAMGLDCEIRVQSNRRSRDVFDNFFNDPFFSKSVRQTINSYPVSIQVLPLPEDGKPYDFNGAVGKYKMSSSISSRQVKANEAITFSVNISGQGNIKMLADPQLDISPDFERYDPNIKVNIDNKSSVLNGSKSYEYVLIPRRAGTKKIKPIRFPYFDTTSKSYKVLTTPEYVINVEKGEQDFTVVGSGFSKEEVRLLGQDIRFIKQSHDGFRVRGTVIYRSLSYLLLLFLPFVALVAAFIMNRYNNRLYENVAYARSKRANRMAQKRLAKAKSFLKVDTQKEFYVQASIALAGFIADKLNRAAAGIITTEIEKELKKFNVGDDLIKRFLDLLQECDLHRFANSATDTAAMEDFYNRAKRTIVEIEKAL